jgi:hypothetical protein
MPLLDIPDKQSIQEGKVSPEASHDQVDHPNEGLCQFERYRGKTCGEICAFTGWHVECRCGSHLYGQFDRGTNQGSSQTPQE